MTHLAKLTPVNGVITDTTSFPKKYRKYVLQFNQLTPNVAGEQCQLSMPDGGFLFGRLPWSAASPNLAEVSQAHGFLGTGAISGSMNVWNPTESGTPAVVIEGTLTDDGDVPVRIKNFWMGGGASVGFTLTYPSGIASGSVDIYGVG